MKQIHDKTNLVLVGAWNPKILTPAWLKHNQFTTLESIQVLVAISNPLAPIQLTLEKVKLNISTAKIIISAVTPDVSLTDIEEFAEKLLALLPHTPITGIGYNLCYMDEAPSAELLKKFFIIDDDDFIEADCSIDEKVIKRKFIIKEKVFYLTQSLNSNNTISFDFNWHFDCIGNAENAMKIITQQQFIEICHITKELMRDIYKYSREEE